MFETLNRAASFVRNAPLLRNQRWLWGGIEPAWNTILSRATHRSGYATRINGEVLRLDYLYGARYDRRDKQQYEREFYEAFTSSVRPGMTVFDVGAHVGILALGAARCARPHLRVRARAGDARGAATTRRLQPRTRATRGRRRRGIGFRR
jgi:hypothetical protein